MLDAGGLEGLGIPRIRHVIGRRLSRLSDEANASLAAASVQGRDFDLDVVARVTGLPTGDVLDSLEEAMDARLVAESATRPGQFRFAHALVRETLYDGRPGSGGACDRMGRPWSSCAATTSRATWPSWPTTSPWPPTPGQAAQAVAFGKQAGDRAMKVLAYEEAAGHYQRALRALDLQA